MIAPELVKELQRLNREERLEVIRILKAKLADEECSEWDALMPKPGSIVRVPSVRVDFSRAKGFLDLEEEQTQDNA